MIEKWNLNMEERKIWITLGGSILFSFLLAVLVILFDTRLLIGVEYLPNWTLTNVHLAREILGLLAGSLLTVATFTFGTMLSIVTLYTSNFSPRATENFLLNRTSMNTLGIFLGGFIYCLASLFFMRSSEDEFLVVSATVALVYALGAVLIFTRFVYTSSEFVQLEKLIHRLYKEAQGVYDNYIVRFEDFHSIKHLPEMSYMYTYDIKADTSAYVEYIDFDTLKNIADKYEANVIISIRIGYFVTAKEPIMEIKTNENLEDEMEEITKRINNSLSYESEKSAMYDPNYAREKLTEVALRAVSPGVNDPNTAIHVLHYKSLLEKRLAGLPGKYVIFHNEEEENKQDETVEEEENHGKEDKSKGQSEPETEKDPVDTEEKGLNVHSNDADDEEEKTSSTEEITSESDEDEAGDNEDDEEDESKKTTVISDPEKEDSEDDEKDENIEEDSEEESEESETDFDEKEDNESEEEENKSERKENEYEKCVFYRYNDFAEDLHSGYWQLVFYMQKDISGVHALFEALKTITYEAHLDNLGFIHEYNEYLYNMTSKNFSESFDQNIIEKDYQTVKTIIEKKKVELED